MATDNIVKVRIGVPGPPGAGVSAAEKATFLTSSGANTFTAAQIIRVSSTGALRAESGAATTDRTLVVDTTSKEVELWNDAKLRGFSDDGTTETFSINAGSGAAQFDGTVTTTRIVGDQVIWPIVIDGGGSTITTGVKGHIIIPYNATVTTWSITADQSGSIVVDFWSDSYANFPPTNADSITTSEEPTLSGAIKNLDTSLNSGNGWTLTGGSYLMWNVDSVATVTRVCVGLYVTRL